MRLPILAWLLLAGAALSSPLRAQLFTQSLDTLTIPAGEFAPTATSLSTLLIDDLANPTLPSDSDESLNLTVKYMRQQLLPEGVRSIGSYTYRQDGKALVEAQVVIFKSAAAAARRWNNQLGEPTAPQNFRAVHGAKYPSFETTTEMTKRYMLIGNVWVTAKEMDPNSPLDHLHVLKRYVDNVEQGAKATP